MAKWYRANEIENFKRANRGCTKNFICKPIGAVDEQWSIICYYNGNTWHDASYGSEVLVERFTEIPKFEPLAETPEPVVEYGCRGNSYDV